MKKVKVGDTLFVTRRSYASTTPIENTEHVVTKVNTVSIYTTEKYNESNREYRFNKKGVLQGDTLFGTGQAFTTLKELQNVQNNEQLERDLRLKLQKEIQTADLETLIQLEKLI